jgi:Fe-S-cluster containining protein
VADFDLQEMTMFARWHACPDLVTNDDFWQDCARIYIDKIITLPVDDTSAERLLFLKSFSCPPGKCGACCRRGYVPLTAQENECLSAGARNKELIFSDNEGSYILDISAGCQFLEGNACTVHAFRPEACRSFPVLEPRRTVSPDGDVFDQLRVNLACRPAVQAVRAILTRVCSGGKLMLLPDLSIIPTYENTGPMFSP